MVFRNAEQSRRPSSFQAAIRSRVAARSAAGSATSSGSSASHDSTCSPRTSGWNWTPHALPEPERLRADRAAGQFDGAVREVVGVVVPLKGVEPRRERRRDRIGGSLGRHLDREPADFGLRGPEDLGTRCPGDQLRPKADAEHGRAALELPLEQAKLRPEPGMAVLLVGMHGAAEDDHSVGALLGNAAAGDVALDELVAGRPRGVLEDAGADVVAVGEREDPHAASLPSTQGR